MSDQIDPSLPSDEGMFNYTNLQEVDPTFKAIPEAVYRLQVIRAQLAFKEAKPGNKMGLAPGDKYGMLLFGFAVRNNPEYGGRRVSPSPLFEGASTLKKLRRLMDATGVIQQPGTPLDVWLKDLVEQQAEVCYRVTVVKDRRDPQVDTNDIDWWSAAVAE